MANKAPEPPYEAGQNLRAEYILRTLKRPTGKHAKHSLRTPERAVAVLSAIRMGATRNAAAAAGGMNRMTLWRWVTEDEDMARLVEEAEGNAELRYVSTIQTAATTTWQAAAWWLERRRPTTYGRKDRMDVSIEARTLAEEYARAEGFDSADIINEAQRVLDSHRERTHSEPED